MRLVARKWWTALGGAAGALSLAASAPVAMAATAAATAATTAVAAAAVTACGDDCACSSPEVDVVVPAEDAAEVTSVTATGSACPDAAGTCDQQGTTGCVDYAVVPSAAGECAVTVTFSDGSLQNQSFTFGGTPTCCGDLGGGGELDVVAP